MEHKHDNEAALSTRIRFRLKTQLFLSVFKKIHVHTRTGKRRFRKVPLWRTSSKSFVFGDQTRGLRTSLVLGVAADTSEGSSQQKYFLSQFIIAI